MGLGLYETEPRSVEARPASVLRRCVEMGLGVALVLAVAGQPPPSPHATLHERPMGRYFGKVAVYLVRRLGVHQHPAVHAFAEEVRARLASRRKRERSGVATG